MGSRPAIIKQRDVTRIVKGYAEAGVAVEMYVENGVPIFRPVDMIKAANEPSSESAREAAYREWKARHAG